MGSSTRRGPSRPTSRRSPKSAIRRSGSSGSAFQHPRLIRWPLRSCSVAAASRTGTFTSASVAAPTVSPWPCSPARPGVLRSGTSITVSALFGRRCRSCAISLLRGGPVRVPTPRLRPLRELRATARRLGVSCPTTFVLRTPRRSSRDGAAQPLPWRRPAGCSAWVRPTARSSISREPTRWRCAPRPGRAALRANQRRHGDDPKRRPSPSPSEIAEVFEADPVPLLNRRTSWPMRALIERAAAELDPTDVHALGRLPRWRQALLAWTSRSPATRTGSIRRPSSRSGRSWRASGEPLRPSAGIGSPDRRDGCRSRPTSDHGQART